VAVLDLGEVRSRDARHGRDTALTATRVLAQLPYLGSDPAKPLPMPSAQKSLVDHWHGQSEPGRPLRSLIHLSWSLSATALGLDAGDRSRWAATTRVGHSR